MLKHCCLGLILILVASALAPVLQAEESTNSAPQVAAPITPTAPSPFLRSITNRQGRLIRTTNMRPYTNELPADPWAKLAGAVQAPGSYWLTTNANGQVMSNFNLQPVVTNMTALTNEIPVVQANERLTQEDVRSLLARETVVKRSLIEDNAILVGIVTNFVPVDDEGKKIKEKITKLEAELVGLRAEMKKRLEKDPAFSAAKAKMDASIKEYKDIQERKKTLRGKRNELAAEEFQINELKRRQALKASDKSAVGAGTR